MRFSKIRNNSFQRITLVSGTRYFDGRTDRNRDEDIIRVPGLLNDFSFRSYLIVGTLLWKKFGQDIVPNCPECTAKERNAIREKNADNADVDLTELFDKIEIPMKFDPNTKHFICKRCGLYATREQVGDIRERLNRKESTKQDKQYDYLDWWQKSKKEKQQH